MNDKTSPRPRRWPFDGEPANDEPSAISPNGNAPGRAPDPARDRALGGAPRSAHGKTKASTATGITPGRHSPSPDPAPGREPPVEPDRRGDEPDPTDPGDVGGDSLDDGPRRS